MYACICVCMYVCMRKSMFVFSNIFGRFTQIFHVSHIKRLQSCVQLSMNCTFVFRVIFVRTHLCQVIDDDSDPQLSPIGERVCQHTGLNGAQTSRDQFKLILITNRSRRRPTCATKC